jgi:chromosome segregation ATPase
MARAGIYKSEVVRARNNLLAMGRYPSIDAIRSELGNTGSKGTIHRYLKEIEEEEGGSTGTQVAVSEAIQDLSARLAERLHQEADQRVAALTEKHKAEMAALNEALAALRNEVESFRGQAERQAIELAAEKAGHTDTQAKLQDERIARAQLVQRVEDMEGQLAREEAHRVSLEEKHQHAREALEHFRSAAREQREQDQRQFEQQIQFLQGELRAAKDTLNAKQQELIRSHEDNARLSSELTQARSELHRLEGEARSLRPAKEQLAVANEKHRQLSEQLAQSNERSEGLRKENERAARKLQETIQAEHRLEADLAAAKAVLATQEQVIAKLTAIPPATKSGPPRKGSAEPQESLFDRDQ